MKQFKFLALVVFASFMLTSCRSTRVSRTIPTAINTVNSVRLSELNLVRKDYTILKSITAEAVVLYKEDGDNKTTIEEETGEFSIVSEFKEDIGWTIRKHKGIARYGFLTNDYGNILTPSEVATNPGYVARNLAIFRAINQCKVAGGDGLIEPVISMSVEERADKKIAFKTVVTAKLIKLNTDK